MKFLWTLNRAQSIWNGALGSKQMTWGNPRKPKKQLLMIKQREFKFYISDNHSPIYLTDYCLSWFVVLKEFLNLNR